MRRAPGCRLEQLPAPQHHRRRSLRTRRGDLLPRGFWRRAVCELIEGGCANQGACRPRRSCSSLFLRYPHSSVDCVHSVLLSEPKLLLFHGVTFSKACLLSCEKLCDLAVHLWSGLIVELLKLSLVRKTLAQSETKQKHIMISFIIRIHCASVCIISTIRSPCVTLAERDEIPTFLFLLKAKIVALLTAGAALYKYYKWSPPYTMPL